MKKTLFSFGIYKESMRRLRVIGFIALVFLLVVQMSPVIIGVVDYAMMGKTSQAPTAENFATLTWAMATVSTLVAPLMVLIAFSIFNKRASSDFYHALPYTRPCVFVSIMAAVYTWTAIISIVCTLGGYIGMLSLPKIFTVVYDGAFDLMLTYFVQGLMTSGACALGMALTGTLLSNVCVTGLILFLPRFIITVMTTWISSNADFLAIDASGTSFLSMNINVLFAGVVSSMFYGNADLANNVPADIYSLCLSLVYVALGLFAFVKRKSETATQPSPNRFVQHVIRIMVSLVLGICAVMIFLEDEIAGGIVLSLITMVVYFAYEIITTKKWKNCLKAIPGLFVLAALCVVCGVTMVAVPKVSANYTPAADEVDSVRIVMNGQGYYGDSWFGLEAQNVKLEGEEIVSIVCEALKSNIDLYREHGNRYTSKIETEKANDTIYTITVAFENGISTKYRNLFIAEGQYEKLAAALRTNDEYTKACKKLPEPILSTMTFGYWMAEEKMLSEYKQQIFDCLQEEVNALDFEEWYILASDGYRYDREDLAIDYATNTFDEHYVYIPISAKMFPKTFDLIVSTKHLAKGKVLSELEFILEDKTVESACEDGYISIEAYVTDTDKDGSYKGYYAYFYVDSMDEKEAVGDVDQRHQKGLQTLIESLKKTDGEPTVGKYIWINYTYHTYDYTSDDDSIYGTVYLPLPDDFDFEKWEFSVRGENSPEVEYYD